MMQTLQSHIHHLEERIQTMSDRLTRPVLTPEDRTRIQSEILIAELALDHYRKAYELEQTIV